MRTFGRLLLRISTVVALAMMVVVAALPDHQAIAATPLTSDDFNRCSLNSAVWTFENPANVPATTITGQFQGDSALVITVPAGQDLTFSNTNLNAPRIMQSATDTSFELEVKFNSPLGQPPLNSWNIQGILIRDTVSVPGKTRWLRFDLDTNNASINYFIGYIDENNFMRPISGPNVINSGFNTAPLYMRVKYDQALGQWSFGYKLWDAGTFAYKKVINESDPLGNLPGGFTFSVSGAGVFAGTTGTTPPGITSHVDYFKDVADTAFSDDANTITVQTAGSGQGTVNWPMTNPAQQCSGNTVTLTATPANGSTFAGWTGNVTSTQASIPLAMTKAYNLTATFNSGQPIVMPYSMYIPIIRR